MPGGFGTLDEMFEAVTLVQTKKVKPFPVILVGDDGYWDGLIDWINDTMVGRGKVRADEVEIIQRAQHAAGGREDPEAAAAPAPEGPLGTVARGPTDTLKRSDA